jgi:hypothetical protein
MTDARNDLSGDTGQAAASKRYDNLHSTTLLELEVLYHAWKLGGEAIYEAIKTGVEIVTGHQYHKQNFRRFVDVCAARGYLQVHACHVQSRGRPATRRFEITNLGKETLKSHREQCLSLANRLTEVP